MWMLPDKEKRNRCQGTWLIYRCLSKLSKTVIWQSGCCQVCPGTAGSRIAPVPDAIPAIIDSECFDAVQHRCEIHRQVPAHNKADGHDLLTTKLFCGKCGSMMAGESGRSHTGAVRCYYKCDTRKRGGKEACSLKSERKEPLEQFVVQTALEKVLNDRFIDLLADKLLEYQSKENTHLPVLQAELKEVERRIDNLVAVIEQGILTPSTKTRISSKKWSSGSNAGAFGWSAFRLTMALSLPTVSPTAKKTCQLFLSKRLHASGFATN